MTTDQASTWAEEELEIDDIRNSLLEAFDQTNDVNGPHWETMAKRVYERHIAPALLLIREIEHTRQNVAAEAVGLRLEITAVERLLAMTTERANRQAQEINDLRAELDHNRTHRNGLSHARG